MIDALSRDSERRYVRAMAQRYNRRHHLPAVMGWTIPTPNGGDPELTRRIIRALGHRLHYQIVCGRPGMYRRARVTRFALFGECLRLKRQLAEQHHSPSDGRLVAELEIHGEVVERDFSEE